MSIDEMAKVLAKIQLIDNREVTKLVILEWHDEVGELVTYDQAIGAVRRFRRERPDGYMTPGHLLQYAEPVRSFSVEDQWMLDRG